MSVLDEIEQDVEDYQCGCLGTYRKCFNYKGKSIIIGVKEFCDIEETTNYKRLESLYEAGRSTCAYL